MKSEQEIRNEIKQHEGVEESFRRGGCKSLGDSALHYKRALKWVLGEENKDDIK